ncbi:sulfatase-like hydrolase/transferase [Vibrio cortegadensis]|uniref:sulfatase-like hydrolase/transferase n=1 Tax=Vibrio cortegadensis TaxID=1328770 RepID=UPI0021C265B6|nr:sulfatase-like hydrolase/transferase [Vibrio cortegadensis]MDN3697266.1 sulfatase-like hydrolase/transferase [Vibrio cortegadensis]
MNKLVEVIKRHKIKTAIAVAVAAACAYPVIKVVSYEAPINQKHLEAKKTYISGIQEQSAALGKADRPNIIFMVLDDMAYNDLSSYGSKAIKTPNIDALAENGLRMTNYYTAAPTSTPSRASMMTGRFPIRNSLLGVVWPEGHVINDALKVLDVNVSMAEDEILMPEVMSAAGYSTAMIGKWHIGERSKPHEHGFDNYFGGYFSNDMPGYTIWENDEVAIPAPVDQTKLNDAFFDKAHDYIDGFAEDKPFFMYFAHAFPHVPLFVPEDELGKSDAGLYGDVMEDIDREVGELVQKLKDSNKFDNTVFVITSDNGAWFDGDNGGNARGRKFETWDGGHKVPFIVSWPAKIKEPAVVDTLLSGVDMFPTFAELAGVTEMPQDRDIDGHNLSPLFNGNVAEFEEANDDRIVWYYNNTQIDALRTKDWKYRGPVGIYSNDMGPTISIKQIRHPHLTDYSIDTRESYDVSAKHPEVAAQMKALLDAENQRLIDNPRGWKS